jgi:hypothetical protein
MLRLQALDHHFEKNMLVARLGNGFPYALTDRKGTAVKRDAKPAAEFRGVRERLPDTRAWRVEQCLSFYSVGRYIHMQPCGCILKRRRLECNRLVAYTDRARAMRQSRVRDGVGLVLLFGDVLLTYRAFTCEPCAS